MSDLVRASVTALISFQYSRIHWMVEEILNRSFKKERMLKALREENNKLRKSLETVRERDELLNKSDSRRVERNVATVSTETEAPDVEMTDDPVFSPPFRDIDQSLVGALKKVIERKMGEILSRVGFPTKVNSKGLKSSGNSKAQAPKDINTWSEVVKRSRGKSSLQREATPSREEKERKVAQASVQPVTEDEPKSTERRRMRAKDKRKERPTLPRTAVVLTAPAGKEAACVELLRRAKEEISIEEVEVPPLEIRRARTGGLILGVPGQHPQEGADRFAAKLAGLAQRFGGYSIQAHEEGGPPCIGAG